MAAAFPTVNPGIVNQLEQIKNIEQMKTRFAPVKNAFKEETQFSKVYSLGALALGLIAGFVYTRNYFYPALALGAAALVLGLTKSRVTVNVPTQDTLDQRTAVNALFKGAAFELRTAWKVVSGSISSENNEHKYATVAEANQATAALLQSLNFQEIEPADVEKPWLEQFVRLKPHAEHIAALALGDDDKAALSPYFLTRFEAVQTECSRLVTGKAEEPVAAYVENTLGAEVDAVVVSKPWSASALKA